MLSIRDSNRHNDSLRRRKNRRKKMNKSVNNLNLNKRQQITFFFSKRSILPVLPEPVSRPQTQPRPRPQLSLVPEPVLVQVQKTCAARGKHKSSQCHRPVCVTPMYSTRSFCVKHHKEWKTFLNKESDMTDAYMKKMKWHPIIRSNSLLQKLQRGIKMASVSTAFSTSEIDSLVNLPSCGATTGCPRPGVVTLLSDSSEQEPYMCFHHFALRSCEI